MIVQKVIAIITWLSCILLTASPVISEENPIVFSASERMTIVDGLASSDINVLTNEPSGLIWVGTQSGINMLDGHDIQLFSQQFSAQNDFPITSPTAMLIDKHNRLWVGSWSQGFGWIEPNRKKARYFYPDNGGKSTSLRKIQTLYESADGSIWLGTHGQGLVRFDPVTEAFESFKPSTANSVSLYDNIQQILQDDSGHLWIATAAGISWFDTIKKEFTTEILAEDLSFSERLILSMVWANGSLWLGSASGFMEYHIESKTLTKYEPKGYVSTSVNAITASSNNGLWLATFNGLMHFDILKKTFSRFVDGKYTFATGTEIQAILNLHPETLMLATRRSGLLVLNTADSIFQSVKTSKAIQTQSHSIWQMTEDVEGNIWLATDAGVAIYQPSLDLYKQVPETILRTIKSKIISVTSSHEGHRIWLSTNNDIYSYNLQSQTLISHKQALSNSGRIKKIFADKKNNIWISTVGQGVFKLREHGQVTQYSSTSTLPSLTIPFDSIIDFLEDESGRIWMLSRNGQLLVKEAETAEFSLFEYLMDDRAFRFEEIATDFHEIDNQQVLISTFTGLIIIDLASQTSRKVTVEQGLASNEVRGIVSDSFYNIWLSTSVGVTRYNPETGETSHFSSQDGLTSTSLNIGATLLASDSTLYFGTDKDLHKVNTLNSKALHSQAPIYITEVWVNNRKIDDFEPNTKNKTLLLESDERNLVFKYAIYDHRPHAKNELYYSLTGFDEKWRRGNISRTATYTNLAPGDYKFEVRVAGSNSNTPPSYISLHIAPSLFENVWIRLAIVFVIATLSHVFYKFRVASLKKSEARLNKLVKNRTDSMIVLSHIGQEITSSLSFDEILENVKRHLSKVLHSNLILLGTLNDSNNTVEFQDINATNKGMGFISLDNTQHPVVECLKYNKTVSFDRPNEVQRFFNETAQSRHKRDYRSLIIQPLIKDDKKLGCLCVLSKTAFAYNNYDKQFLSTISAYTAIALDNAIVNSQQQQAQQQRINWLVNINGYLRHEMKNAMLGAKTSIAMVRRKLTDNELTKYLNRADQSHDEMRHILNAVADTTSLEVSIMRAQKNNIDLSEILIERMDYFALVYPTIRINMDVEPDVQILGNQELLDQLIDKLVNNAIEHHSEGSDVFFSLSVKDMQCFISVQNYGMPLPSLDESIFDLFVSTKANTNSANLGMGLYIANLISEFHNGSISAQTMNTNNQSGAKFTVTLPILIE